MQKDMIKVLCCDVDGTLTDGRYYVSNDGSISKSFHTLDFYAINQLCLKDIFVVIITQSDDGVIDEKISNLDSKKIDLITGSKDKKSDLEFWLDENDLKWENVFYIGDADNDIDCMSSAAFAGCPSSAIPAVRQLSSVCSDQKGGEGAVYDIIQKFIALRFPKSSNG